MRILIQLSRSIFDEEKAYITEISWPLSLRKVKRILDSKQELEAIYELRQKSKKLIPIPPKFIPLAQKLTDTTISKEYETEHLV